MQTRTPLLLFLPLVIMTLLPEVPTISRSSRVPTTRILDKRESSAVPQNNWVSRSSVTIFG